LVESTTKKAAFLREVVGELGLDTVVLPERAEVAARRHELRGSYATASARAVGAPSTVAELTLPFLKVGGQAILQRGGMNDADRAALEDALLVLGGKVIGEHALGADRRIVLVEKTGPTPERFPRRAGIPAKRPLGGAGVSRETYR